jgi:quinohemoprotein ethanol dehydrogenase
MTCLTSHRCFAMLLFLFISACNSKERGIRDVAIADESQTSDWLSYGRTHIEKRFSPFTTIDITNVNQLKVDWYLDFPGDNFIGISL